jgi:hypothetical protein
MQQLEMLETTDELRCSVCEEIKPKTEFDKSPYKRGWAYKCKSCQKDYKRWHYLKNKDDYRTKSKHRSLNSVKTKAVAQVNSAIAAGKLTRKPCEKCGAEKAEGHHDDYAKPLEVRWLCRTHHRRWHKKHGEAPNACTVRHWTPPQEDTQ